MTWFTRVMKVTKVTISSPYNHGFVQLLVLQRKVSTEVHVHNQGFLQPAVPEDRGLITRGLTSRVLTTRVLQLEVFHKQAAYNRSLCNKGVLQPGVLQPRFFLQTGVLTTSSLTTMGSYS